MERNLALTKLRGTARRWSRCEDEAEDLLQDALAEAVATGRADIGVPANRAWLAGVLRKRAAELARSAVRRRARESAYATTVEQSSELPHAEALDWSGLPPALGAVARLVLAGHTREEISYLLGISNAALRQRITALRRRLVQSGAARPADFSGLTRPLPYGRFRSALRQMLLKRNARLGAHDPDGHLFLIAAKAGSQNGGSRQQGVGYSTNNDLPHFKEPEK